MRTELTDQIRSIFQKCELARFAGIADSQQAAEVLNQTETILAQI
jgi:hypothetical protein